MGLTKKTKKFNACYNIDCEDCMFNDAENCINDKIKWAYAEYTTSEVDWSNYFMFGMTEEHHIQQIQNQSGNMHNYWR